MRRKLIGLMAILSCFALAPSNLVAKKNHGGGGGGGGGSSTIPVNVIFRDCTAGQPSAAFWTLHPGTISTDWCTSTSDDRLKSDTGSAYEDGIDGVQAFIALTGSTGALGVRLANSPRALSLDFTDCASAPCNPPFQSQEMTYTSLDVDANTVKQNGLLGMAVGEKISAPMTVLFSDTQDLSGNVWFIDFNPGVKGKNPCKNKSNYVTVERTSDTSWEVVFGAASIGCLEINNSPLGTYLMPFQFTVVEK